MNGTRSKPSSLILTCLIAVQIGCTSILPADEPEDEIEEQAAVQWFTELGPEVGFEFVHESGMDGSYLMPQILGSGGALLDYDGDGDLDVFLVNSGSLSFTAKGKHQATNRLFRQGVGGSFEEVTADSGLNHQGYGMGCAVGDIDNDGDPDIYVTNFGVDELFLNHGDGTFVEVTRAAGITGEGWSTSAVFVDFDRDGFLDLFVTRYVNFDPPKVCTDLAGKLEYCGPASLPAVSDMLYRNNGDGTFTDL